MTRFRIQTISILIILLIWLVPNRGQIAYSRNTAGVRNLGPSSWWCQMKYNSPLLILYGNNISGIRPSFNYRGVTLKNIYPTRNPHYLIFDISISPNASPGRFEITLPGYKKGDETITFNLLSAGVSPTRETLSARDAIYQIVPDRFCNGDPRNDNPDGFLERTDLTNPSGIYGGDLSGINQHIDYLVGLGITTLELTPLYLSNQFILSYERMAPTHLFRIDPHLGTLPEYRSLVSSARRRGLKTIQTLLLNQIGSQHPLVKDPPDNNWVIPVSKTLTVDHNPFIFADPHASPSDRKKYTDTFDTMDAPLVNQSNELMRKHLIQHLIWWVKQSGVDGIRIEKTHLNQTSLLKEAFAIIKKEFPTLTVIASAHTKTPAHNQFWNSPTKDSFSTHITDAPLQVAISNAFTAYQQVNEALYPLYTTASSDFLYSDATNQLLVYADQHHLSRAFTLAEKDPAIFRMMMGFIFTFRGIPSILYGSEIMLPGLLGEGSGFVRAPLPGGWPNDRVSVFNPQTLSANRQEALNYMTRLLNWRKSNPDLLTAKLTHFEPQNGLYIYLRETPEKGLLVILNNHRTTQQRIQISALTPHPEKYRMGRSIISGAISQDLERLIVGPKSIIILELQP